MENSKYTVRWATAKAVCSMVGRLRKSDEDECQAFHGESANVALLRAYQTSEKCWVIFEGEKAIGAFGVAKYARVGLHASIWLLGTEELNNVGVAIFRRSRRFIEEMMRGFTQLENWVDARNHASIRWLRWCGFTIDPAVPVGAAGLPFHYFYICAPL